jgi:antitoxin component of MazEF toxin-antitoxin module
MQLKSSMTIDVVEDDNGELALQFPDDLMEQLGWEVGDIINWELDDENRVIVRRVVPDSGPIGP